MPSRTSPVVKIPSSPERKATNSGVLAGPTSQRVSHTHHRHKRATPNQISNKHPETTKFYQLSRQVYVDFVGSSLLYRFKPFSFDSPTLLLNYLCVINPLHRNAIRSITLNINFRPTCTTLPNKAFTCLSKCEGLEDLNIHIHVPQDLYRFGPIFHRPANSTVNRSTYEIIDKRILQRIKDCETLKGITGLKKFELVFVLPDRISPYFNRHFPHHHFFQPKLEPSESTVAFYAEMKEMMENRK